MVWRDGATNPDQEKFRTEAYDGKPSLRFATASKRASDGCSTCHKVSSGNEPTALSSVMEYDATEVIVPLDSELRKVNSRALTFGAMAGSVASAIGWIVGWFNRRFSKR